MTDHMLTPLRSFSEAGHLITNADVLVAEEVLSEYGAIPAGRCMHLTDATGPNQTPVAKLGCVGNNKVPVWIFRPSDSYSAGFEGPDSATEVGPSWDTGVEKKLLMFVGLEGTELITTEFDKTRDYKVGEYLKAPEMGQSGAASELIDAQTKAGVVTNAAVVHGAQTIVGIVSPGAVSPMDDVSGRDVYGNFGLSLYTCYKPPVAGLIAGIPTDLTA